MDADFQLVEMHREAVDAWFGDVAAAWPAWDDADTEADDMMHEGRTL